MSKSRSFLAAVLVAALSAAQAAATAGLSDKDRDALSATVDDLYDVSNAGWGNGRKYLDVAAMEWSLANVDQGNQLAMTKARRTLDANRNLLDPTTGGVFDYAAQPDWSEPHNTQLLAIQADDLRLYSDAIARWHRPNDIEAAKKIYGFITNKLSAPDRGFYTGQTGTTVDKREQLQPIAKAIRALAKYADVTGDAQALTRAEQAAKWTGATASASPQTAAAGGGTNKSDSVDAAVSLSQAYLALYRSTGSRPWLKAATDAIDPVTAQVHNLHDPIQAAETARAANRLYHYTAAPIHLQLAQQAMKQAATAAASAKDVAKPSILLADHELSDPPIHITIVGGKNDPAAKALHAAALQYPTDYLQVDWWDKHEGKLPDPSITYPELKQAAAFACTANACSTPVFNPEEIQARVHSVLN